MGCLSQSGATRSQKLALMRAVGPVSSQDCALKQHEAESSSSLPGEMLRLHKAKASPPPPFPNHLLAKPTLYARLLSKCFPLPQLTHLPTSLSAILPRPAQILFRLYLSLNPQHGYYMLGTCANLGDCPRSPCEELTPLPQCPLSTSSPCLL